MYTYYRYIVTDFGIEIAVALTGMVGFLHTLLFRKAHSGSPIGLYFFSLTMSSVLMVIFDDAYWRFGLYFSAFTFAVIYYAARSLPGGYFRPRDEVLSTHPQ